MAFVGILVAFLVYLPLLVAAAVLIVLGLWGKPRWSAPYCAKCRYDLRGRLPAETDTCPECGSALTGKKSVGFVRYGRRWGLIVLAIALLLWPFLLLGGTAGYRYFAARSMVPNPGNMAQQTTPDVIAYVKANPDKPWGWKELGKRSLAGQLSQSEVDRVVDDFVAHLSATYPQGMGQPLNWSGDFLLTARKGGVIDDARMMRLMDAYYGPIPHLGQPLERARPGQRLGFNLRAARDWDPFHQSDIGLLSYLREARIDGKPVLQPNPHRHRHQFQGSLNVPDDLAPGEYEVVFETDLAYVNRAYTAGLDEGESPENWPDPLKRWTAQTIAKLTVLGPEDRPVSPTSEPRLAPKPGQNIRVAYCVARRDPKGVRVSLRFEVEAVLVPLSFDVLIQANGQKYSARDMTYVTRADGSGSYSGLEQELILPDLPAESGTIDILLRPNPEHVYLHSGVTECWGEEVALSNVPIKRLDQDEPRD